MNRHKQSLLVSLLSISITCVVGCGDTVPPATDGGSDLTAPQKDSAIEVDMTSPPELPPDLSQLDTNAADMTAQPDLTRPDLSDPLANDMTVLPPSPDLLVIEPAHVRLVHASPAMGAMDIYLQGATTPLFAGVALDTATSFADLPPGNVVFEVRAAGDAPTVAPKYVSDPLVLTSGLRVTSVALGNPAATDVTRFQIKPVTENFAAPTAGQARLRFVEASIVFTPSIGIDLADDGTADVSGLLRFDASDAAGQAVTAGSALPLAILKSTGERQTSFTLPASALGDGSAALVVLVGNNAMPHDPTSFVLLVVGANGPALVVRQDPSLFLLNAIADPIGVDCFVGNTKVATSTFGGAIKKLQGSPSLTGTTLAVYPTSAATTPPATGLLGTFSTGAIAAGERYLAVLSGLTTITAPASGALQLNVYRDDFVPKQADGFGRVRIINAVADLASIDVGRYVAGFTEVVDGTTNPFDALGFAAASPAAGTPIVANAAQVGLNPTVRQTGTTAPIKHFLLAAQMSTDRFFGIPAGTLAPTGTQQLMRFLVINAPRESLGAMTVKASLPAQ
jgi:hypothetical protein